MNRKLPRLALFGIVVLIALLSSFMKEQRRPTQDQPESDTVRAPITWPSQEDTAASSQDLGELAAEAPADSSPDSTPQSTPDSTPTTAPADNKFGRAVARNVTVRDQHRGVVFEGDVELTDTLARIDAGRRLSFPNDGTVFQNRERRLPKQATGYYREWVHPTPGISGPGPQRVVTGQANETYYTPDHYRTFQRVR